MAPSLHELHYKGEGQINGAMSQGNLLVWPGVFGKVQELDACRSNPEARPIYQGGCLEAEIYEFLQSGVYAGIVFGFISGLLFGYCIGYLDKKQRGDYGDR